MTTTPQFVYIILVLPGLFGLTLFGEGVNKVIHEEWIGVVSMIFGLIFLGGIGVYLALNASMY